jgi:poly [ADP-ribose] polymerase 2/3/4
VLTTQSTETLSERLIYTDLSGNNNKFWHANIVGSTLSLEWGRIGTNGQRKSLTFNDHASAVRDFERRRADKIRHGYTKQHILDKTRQHNVALLAKVQIDHSQDPETSQLIDFLVKRNVHKIEGTTNIRLENGQLTTPLGVVTIEGVDEAEKLLSLMAVKGADLNDLANQYLRIVPRDIGRTRVDPYDLFGAPHQLVWEQAVLDSLRAVVKDIEQRSYTDAPLVFQTKLTIVMSSDEEFARIDRMFKSGLNRKHHSANMRLRQVWRMSIESCDAAFRENLGNVRRLWHGTKDANLLSILKNGFVIPNRNSGIAITGRMFGDGIYFSDQSTKSLNYASGYWGGGGSQRCFMLLNDVAMGREYIPRGGFRGLPPSGYDSTFAQAGRSGVLNNEMIVYKEDQVKPVYLAEFR